MGFSAHFNNTNSHTDDGANCSKHTFTQPSLHLHPVSTFLINSPFAPLVLRLLPSSSFSTPSPTCFSPIHMLSVISLDFSKAFDSVRHSTLLSKMSELDLPTNVYNWMVSLLFSWWRKATIGCSEKSSTTQAMFCTDYFLLPQQRSSNYNLRRRPHDRQMPDHTTHLADKNFLIRILFKDSY